MKVSTETTVTIVLTGKEASDLAVYLNVAKDHVADHVQAKTPVARDLLYILREIPDDGEEVHPR
jgi:hypothetical protein